MKKVDYTLYFITNSDGYDEETFLNKVKGACLGGATIIQLREKNKSTLDIMNWQLKSKI
jgi:thiamine-phosphate pyrophosphorylase